MSVKDRVVAEKVLTEHVSKYQTPQAAGHFLFPNTGVKSISSKVIYFDDSIYEDYDTERAPGTDYNEIEFGYYGDTVQLGNHGVRAKVPREEKTEMEIQLPSFSTAANAIEIVMSVEERKCEKDKATLARDPNNYDADHKVELLGMDKWSDFDNSTPVQDIELGKEVIAGATGVEPNTILIPYLVMKKLKWHPKILESIPSDKVTKATIAHLKDIFEIEHVVIGKSMGKTKGVPHYYWGTDVVLANVNHDNPKNRKLQSYGYNYHLEGHPFVEKPWFSKRNKSHNYDVTNQSRPYITDKLSGYLIRNAV